MPVMLRHRTTGVQYPYNRDMAKHPDMEKIDQPDPQFAEKKKEALAEADAQVDEITVAAQKKADAAMKKAAVAKKKAALAASKKAEAAAKKQTKADAADDVDLSGIDLTDA